MQEDTGPVVGKEPKLLQKLMSWF